MTETVTGKKIHEFEAAFTAFHELLTTGNAVEQLGKLKILAGVIEFPVRVKCATLAWHTLKAALTGCTDLVSTEN